MKIIITAMGGGWHVALWLAVLLVALFVALASACRINNLNPSNHKRSWSLMYLWMAGSGAGVLGYAATMPTSAELLALLGATQMGPALNLLLTWKQWRMGLVPAIAQNDATRAATDVARAEVAQQYADTRPPEREPGAARNYPHAHVASMQDVVEHIP
jgi:hypothetical protein